MNRCQWPNLENSTLYMQYHDTEWGVASHDDDYLFEMFVLESFHCGLSWLLMLKKRDAFRAAFDGFDATRIVAYDEEKIESLMADASIVRNHAKILATIQNAKAFLEVQREYGSFSDFLWSFTDHKVVSYPFDGTMTRNELSDTVAKALKKRGFKFMGTVTTFSYLEACGIMNNHAITCDLCPAHNTI